jgi:4'-phosphopantetheinyl transferase
MFYLEKLPRPMRSKILKYRRWQDAERSLLGKALLMQGLEDAGLRRPLTEMKFSNFDKPYFDHSFDFNISHSGDYVICAIHPEGKIGIDVEEVIEVPLEDFDMNFSKREWDDILSGNNQLYNFYSYWTKKEAFLKAIGMGLNVPLIETEVINDRVRWQNKEWFLQEVKLDEKHISYFASEIRQPETTVREIIFT